MPTSVSYKYDDDLATLRNQLESESGIREVAVHGLQLQLAEINQSDAQVADLQSRLNALRVRSGTFLKSIWRPMQRAIP